MNWIIDLPSNKEVEITSIKDLMKTIGEEDPYIFHGFTYILTYLDENNEEYYYIGKKNFWSETEHLSKKNKLPRPGHLAFIRHRKNGRLVEYELIKAESDWLKYEGSFDKPKGYTLKSKKILELSKSKRYLTYLEVKYLFLYNAIIDDRFLNKQILNSFYRGRILEDDKIDYRNQDLATNGGRYAK